jgi:hypothetical protein
MMLSYGELVRLIKDAGREPVERNSRYETVRTFAPDDPIFTGDPGPSVGGDALVQLVGTGRA